MVLHMVSVYAVFGGLHGLVGQSLDDVPANERREEGGIHRNTVTTLGKGCTSTPC